eukprot:scaffold4347_cov55-Attheya_sp.AAC.2
MDPMAGIGGNGPSPTDQTNSNEREVLDMTAAMANHKKVDTIRSFMGIVSGCVAGILGLTGLEGLVSVTIYCKMGFDLKTYSRESALGFWTADVQKSVYI